MRALICRKRQARTMRQLQDFDFHIAAHAAFLKDSTT
jgi:hypothetical protein